MQIDKDELDPMRLPMVHWTPGNKDELKFAVMMQVIIILLSWGRTADSDGIPLSEQDVVEILQNAAMNYGPNKEDMDNATQS